MRLDPLKDPDAAAEQEDAHIRQLLGQMPVARPSSRLDDHVRSTLLRGRGRWIAVGTFSSAAAALVALAIVLPRHSSSPLQQIVSNGTGSPVPPVSSAVPHRLRIERDVKRIDDAGVVALINGVPIREMHYRGEQQVWYFDAKRNTRLSVTVPVDRVIMVPVHTF
jgi:hypothetical protein